MRIHRPELLQLANVHPDYADLLGSVADSTRTLEQTLAAVEKGLANPRALSATRRDVAADLFYQPGTATARTAAYLYEAMALEGAPAGVTAQEATCHS